MATRGHRFYTGFHLCLTTRVRDLDEQTFTSASRRSGSCGRVLTHVLSASGGNRSIAVTNSTASCVQRLQLAPMGWDRGYPGSLSATMSANLRWSSLKTLLAPRNTCERTQGSKPQQAGRQPVPFRRRPRRARLDSQRRVCSRILFFIGASITQKKTIKKFIVTSILLHVPAYHLATLTRLTRRPILKHQACPVSNGMSGQLHSHPIRETEAEEGERSGPSSQKLCCGPGLLTPDLYPFP